LDGWAFSSDAEKRERWNETILWAERQGLLSLIPELKESEKYIAHSTDALGSSFGILREQFQSPARKPRPAEIMEALAKLRHGWEEIAGAELAAHSMPFRFVGRKRRRLIVRVDPTFSPPWESWSYIGLRSDRRSFTNLRRSVNQAIQPVHVDHIDFKDSAQWARESSPAGQNLLQGE
jgi:hypothetical protein